MEIIRDIMTTEIEACSILDNVYEAAVKMKELNIGVIPVVDGNRLLGIVTDRDIVVRGIAEKRPNSSKVEKVMTTELVTISPDSSVQDAVELMSQHQIRRLPVVEGDKLVGMVSLGDLAVEEMTDNRAKIALSEISEPTKSDRDFMN